MSRLSSAYIAHVANREWPAHEAAAKRVCKVAKAKHVNSGVLRKAVAIAQGVVDRT